MRSHISVPGMRPSGLNFGARYHSLVKTFGSMPFCRYSFGSFPSCSVRIRALPGAKSSATFLAASCPGIVTRSVRSLLRFVFVEADYDVFEAVEILILPYTVQMLLPQK
jgi:hypothetical protein